MTEKKSSHQWAWSVDGKVLGRHADRPAAIRAAEKHWWRIPKFRRPGRILRVRHERTGEEWRMRGGSWFQTEPPHDRSGNAIRVTRTDIPGGVE